MENETTNKNSVVPSAEQLSSELAHAIQDLDIQKEETRRLCHQLELTEHHYTKMCDEYEYLKDRFNELQDTCDVLAKKMLQSMWTDMRDLVLERLGNEHTLRLCLETKAVLPDGLHDYLVALLQRGNQAQSEPTE